MSDYKDNYDLFIEDWGTPEQKVQLAERRKRVDEWLKDIPVLTIEEAMKRSLNMSMPE